MDFLEYQSKAVRTFKPGEELDTFDARLCNWALGASSEAGELAGLIKHKVFHKQEVSTMEVAKEVGDVLWYLSAICRTLGIQLSDCATLNIAKLEHRHDKSKFSFKASVERRNSEMAFENTMVYEELRRRILGE